jgi:H/ACA ribonucleoprotein complex subunit 4
MKKPIEELLKFGILNIDKPSGPTSFDISHFIHKKLAKYGIKKTSHFGTLDPMVTGVLPIALGRACKFTGFFLGHDKEYIGVMHVHKENALEILQKIIDENFVGKIMQLPPKKSSVKRAVREREIKKFELLEIDEKDFLFLTEVQGGTYIRKLLHDLGEREEVGGAHMAELRRVRAGVFSEEDKEFRNLYDFEKALEDFENGDETLLREMITPAGDAIKKVMKVLQLNVDAKRLKELLTGKKLIRKDFDKIVGLGEGEDFAVFNKENFVEIAERLPGNSPNSFFARPKFVFN